MVDARFGVFDKSVMFSGILDGTAVNILPTADLLFWSVGSELSSNRRVSEDDTCPAPNNVKSDILRVATTYPQ